MSMRLGQVRLSVGVASAEGRPWRPRGEGRRSRDAGRSRDAEQSPAEKRDGVAGYLRSGTGRESLRTQVSPQPQQHKMADTSPRTSRDSALAPSRPLLRPRPASLPFRLIQPPTTSFPSAASRPSSPTRPCLSPGCRAGGGGAAALRRRLVGSLGRGFLTCP